MLADLLLVAVQWCIKLTDSYRKHSESYPEADCGIMRRGEQVGTIYVLFYRITFSEGDFQNREGPGHRSTIQNTAGVY